jgi:prolyl 4-hydroxylase
MNIIKHHDNPLIELHENFLTGAECRHLLSLPVKFDRSKGWDKNTDKPHFHEARTSETAFASNETKDLKLKIANYFSVPNDTIEPLQLQRYGPGQQYRAHQDFFHDGINLKNNRICTFILYLNEDFTGGATEFPGLGFGIRPTAGSGLFFRYDYEDQAINEKTLHAGTPIVTGSKTIITAWFRKNKYKS